MRIAMIAPLMERVPPLRYGGTERIVSYLTEDLVRQGQDVTLFASGDSLTAAKLIPCCREALRLNPKVEDTLPYQVMMLEQLRQRAHEFDVMHFHIDMMHFPVVRSFVRKTLTTLHGRLDIPDLRPFYEAFPEFPLVSISLDQRLPMPPVNWVGTIYHGLPRALLSLSSRSRGDYLAFLGRISPEKRPDRAIEIATRAGMTLKMAAKIDKIDQPYWDEKIRPLVETHPNVDFLGEIEEREKNDFLGNALALVFPIDWHEPFGLVTIESMACGTPVIAFNCGSVPEVIEDGVSGFIVDNVEEAVEAVGRIPMLDRRKVRAAFEARFTADRMAKEYLGIYRRLAAEQVVSTGSRLLSRSTDLRDVISPAK